MVMNKQTTEELKAIVSGAPEGATHVDFEGDYFYLNPDDSSMCLLDGAWEYCPVQEPLQSLSDISEIIALRESNSHAGLRTLLQKEEGRITELEKNLNIANSIIIKTANNIIEMDNCKKDSDEMEECWTVIKEFALIATGDMTHEASALKENHND
jgi:hypothetical protein